MPPNFDLILKGLTASRAGDRCAPGIIFSWLEDQQCYYASVHVFDAGRRKVLVKATGASVEEVLTHVVEEYEKI